MNREAYFEAGGIISKIKGLEAALKSAKALDGKSYSIDFFQQQMRPAFCSVEKQHLDEIRSRIENEILTRIDVLELQLKNL